MREMGSRQSNPVLEILGNVEQVLEGQKYPPDDLRFAGDDWRAFYHCHDSPERPEEEHGHFHLFPRAEDATWAHVVGLSMNCLGQPLRWFAVNRWVTGGPWLRAAVLEACLENLPHPDGMSIVERWLMGMVSVYRPEIRALLHARDRALGTVPRQRVEDRSVYVLAEQSVDLRAKLQERLATTGNGTDSSIY